MSFFSALFRRGRPRIVYSSSSSRPAPFSKNLYEQEIVRAVVDCIAAHAAKGQAMHVIVDNNGRINKIERDSPYTYLLNQKPNELMSGYDLKYRLTTQLQVNTTALCYVRHEEAKPCLMIPIDYNNMEALPLIGGGYAIRFIDNDGREHTLPAAEVAVLRKYYFDKEIFGSGNTPIYNTLDMVKAADDGLVQALTVSNKVRGLLKQKTAMLDPDDVKKSTAEFTQRFMDAAAQGGIVGVDAMEDYAPLNVTPWAANAAQMKDVRENIFRYFRTSENIVLSKYTSPEFQAWYESVLEPIHLQMGLALTNVCFTKTEYDEGNRLIFTSDLMTQMSMDSKANLLSTSKEMGLFTPNEYRAMFGYAPIEDGDERQISLNYIKAKDQSKYQTGKDEENDDEPSSTN